MADRRLQWNQVDAPDLSAASAALARANQSFSGGLDAAQGVIARYGAGRKEKGDNELLSDLASLGSEEEFDAFVDGGGLQGRNITEGLRNRVLDTRSGLVDQAGVRARTDGTRSGTAIREAAEGRTAAGYADGVARRDFTRGNAGNALAAQEFARANGETVGPITEQGGVESQVYQGLLDRGLPEHVAQGFMMNFQDESGFNIGITEGTPNAHGTRGKGLYQLTGARRDAFEAKYGNDYSVDNQLDFLIEEMGGSESAAGRAILGSTTAGEAGSAIVSQFLRPAEEHRAERSARYSGGTYTPGNGGSRQVESPTQAYQRSLVDSGLFSAAEIQARLDPVNAAGAERTSEVAARDAETLREITAAANQDLLNRPDIINDEQLTRAVLSDDNFTATENEARLKELGVLTEANPSRLTPTTAGTPELDANVANTIAAAESDLRSTDQNRAIGDIEAFSEDPASALTQALDLGKDGENPGGLGQYFGLEAGYDQNDLRNMINDYANEFEVEPALVAVAMRDVFKRDPFGRNTLDNRFSKDDVEAAVGQLDQEAIRNFRERKSNNDLMGIELSTLQTQARNLQAQIAKTAAGPQKDALQAQLDALNGRVASIESNRQN